MEVIFLVGLETDGTATHVVTTGGDPEDFKDSKDFYVATNYDDAYDKLGKKWTGTKWEDLPQEPADPTPPKPELPPTDVLTLEAVASLYEKTEALQAKVDAIENASFAALEGIAALAESQITE